MRGCPWKRRTKIAPYGWLEIMSYYWVLLSQGIPIVVMSTKTKDNSDRKELGVWFHAWITPNSFKEVDT